MQNELVVKSKDFPKLGKSLVIPYHKTEMGTQTEKETKSMSKTNGTEIYHCAKCNGDFPEEEMTKHSSGKYIKYCKGCMTSLKKEGLAKAKKNKGKTKKKKKISKKVGNSTGTQVLEKMKENSDKAFSASDFTHISSSPNSLLHYLFDKGDILRVGRGKYKFRTRAERYPDDDDGNLSNDEEFIQANKALKKSNGSTDILRTRTKALLEAFETVGKKVTRIDFIRGTKGVVEGIRYEATEEGEVKL